MADVAAAVAETAAATPKRKDEVPAAAVAPEAKRLKPCVPDHKVVRKQVEYYLSDDNLKHDKFFSEKIATNSEGWLEMALILSCNKMKAMRATKEDVVAALKESTLELRDGGAAVRRPGNAPLPKLEAKPQHFKKTSAHAHDGGAVVIVKGIPAQQTWSQVKDILKEKLPEKISPWHVSEVAAGKAQCTVVCPPFEGDLKLLENLELELEGAKVTCEVCYGELLQQVLKTLPKHIRDKREKEARRKQKERNRPILIGTQRFLNVGALRGKVKEIINSRSDGEALKPEGTDFKLIKALLEFHPKGAEKSQGTTGIKVGKSTQGDNRCFFMVKEDGSEEDVSMKKCIEGVEANPPYIKVTDKTCKAPAPAATPAATPKAAEAPAAAIETPQTQAPAPAATPAATPKAAEDEAPAAAVETPQTQAPAPAATPPATPKAAEGEAKTAPAAA